jgi:rhodanese-related sulfurtransferase
MDLPAASSPEPRANDWRRVLVEGALVLLSGGLVALLANQLSPRGLALTRDYFPTGVTNALAALTVTNTSAVIAPGTNVAASRLRAKGLQIIEHTNVVSLLHDARYASGLVLFVDARDDQHFQEGHIPDAHQLDHYRPEKYLPVVLAACMSAEKIVVYCNGGDCEDSEFTAIMLTQAGVPADRLFVYAGGITEWKQHGEPVELGARGSGVMKEAGQ